MKKYIQKLMTLLAFYACTLSTTWVHAQNLLVNGDFSTGNTGFTSGYSYVPSGQTTGAGSFGIRTSSTDFNSGDDAFGDHTGSGNMLLADGSTNGTAVVWQQTVSVTPNTPYIFSGWAKAAVNFSPPTLKFSINGVQVGLTLATTTAWQQFTTTWNSGASSSAILSVVDTAVQNLGNDLALDDFSFTSGGVTVSATAFTYQGRLNSGTNVANGSYDMTFSLFTTNLGGAAIAGPVTNKTVVVNNGIFTTLVDLGAGAFASSGTWLEIGVVTSGGSPFATLAPRQPVTPTPYAINAAGLSASAQLSVAGLTIQSNTNGAPNIILGSAMNYVNNGVIAATIGGGGASNSQINGVTASFGTVGGGGNNTAGFYSTVGGGGNNLASAIYSTVAGGAVNTAIGPYSTVAGGYNNNAGGQYSKVGGGYNNTASGYSSAVGGGTNNTASGDFSAVAGGRNNTALGNSSFAGGNSAQAVHDGSFVWADNSGGSFASTGVNQFDIRAAGGVGIGTSAPNYPLTVEADAVNADMISWRNSTFELGRLGQSSGNGFMGVSTSTGFKVAIRALGNSYFNGGNVGIGVASGAPAHLLQVGTSSPAYCDGANWVNGSDRNAKKDFAVISPRTVLEKVSALPITEWQYKMDTESVKHIGPMAQDFYAAFGLNGTDDKHISTVDEGGVALAAIQGLNQKVEQKETEIAELKVRLTKLEQFINQKNGGDQ